MNQEDISAFVDDEIGAQDCEGVIDQLYGEPSAQKMWSRYHLIGHVISAHDGARTPSVEPDKVTALAPAKRPINSPLVGLAIAASVALLAVILILRPAPPGATAEFTAAVEPAARPLAPMQVNSLTSVPASRVVPVGSYDQRLNGYLVNFNEQRARLGVPGVHPYVRIVGFEAQ